MQGALRWKWGTAQQNFSPIIASLIVTITRLNGLQLSHRRGDHAGLFRLSLRCRVSSFSHGLTRNGAEKGGEFTESGYLFPITHDIDFSSDEFDSILERSAKRFSVPQSPHEAPPPARRIAHSATREATSLISL